ncbi:MAG: membrane integrity-associated transporter subunit PqiC [Candidatus Delongbacteria bacterium]|nr:membrane integrity-associated transporter subunit PqiC [Candidatus Delongbacteria bacterium]MBN2833756.1 membrane integrity-associated transporter subunit PqiC [Candidatus Delongbacteria bacterium]
MKFIISGLILIFFSCSVVSVENLYILKYIPSSTNPSLVKFSKYLPLNYKIQVDKFEASELLARTGIIIRESMHKLRYDSRNKWAEKPQKTMQTLVYKHLKTQNIFQEVAEDYFDKIPDYYISGKINNLEFYSTTDQNLAYVDIEFYLKDKSENVIVRHSIARNIDINSFNHVYFVKTVSDIISEETDNFVVKIVTELLTK